MRALGRLCARQFRSLLSPREPSCEPAGTGRERLALLSLGRVRPHLPPASHVVVGELLSEVSAEVRVVSRRKTVLGLHRLSPCGTHSLVTVARTGNAYRFLMTLLHELAHARVRQSGIRNEPSHGPAWRACYADLLRTCLEAGCFPADLEGAVRRHAARPRHTSMVDLGLQQALYEHDPPDDLVPVSRLGEGERFSVDGRKVLVRGPLMRTRYLCTDAQGRRYAVGAAVRVLRVTGGAD